MKKFLLVVFAIGLVILPCVAQKSIIITAAQTQIMPGKAHYVSASLTNFIAPKADTNHAWNYGKLSYLANADIDYILNPFVSFSGSNLAIATVGAVEQLTSNCQIPANYVFDEDTLSIYQAGEYISGQNFSLYNYFSNTKDSLYVPKQSDYCRLNILNFPTKAKSVHKKNSVRSLTFSITVTSEGYKKAPGVKNTYFSVKDTVMGWGSLRVPSTDKNSIPYDVLLIKRKTITIDSVFINKKVPMPIYLTALGIIQGKKTTTYEQFFYRAGFVNPIMAINYGNDSTCTNPTTIFYITDSIKSGVRLDANSIEENLSIYPNPSNGRFSCKIAKSSLLPWKLIMTNTLGQTIKIETINGTGELSQELDLENLHCIEGIYYLNIVDENGQTAGFGKICLKKL